MRVQRVIMPVTEAVSWTLLGDDGEPVESVEAFLSFLSGWNARRTRCAIGR